jgi:NAD(P)-dependent dehydrogenase (short-subunit alcohol dehydrogenase family)
MVYATARRAESLDSLQRLGCIPLSLDVTSDISMAAAVDEVHRRSGPLDALVNNAGYSQVGAVESVSIDLARKQFETNVFGLMRLCQLVLPAMRKGRRGRIVNVSSMGGELSFPGYGWYHASKYALEALSDVLRLEVRAFGVDVILIQPGVIRSDFVGAALGSMKEMGSEGDYAAFNRAMAVATEKGYESGAMARLAGDPCDVAHVIERALTARRPKTRYPVAASAHLLLAMRKLMSDRMWDSFMASQYPLPGNA